MWILPSLLQDGVSVYWELRARILSLASSAFYGMKTLLDLIYVLIEFANAIAAFRTTREKTVKDVDKL